MSSNEHLEIALIALRHIAGLDHADGCHAECSADSCGCYVTTLEEMRVIASEAVHELEGEIIRPRPHDREDRLTARNNVTDYRGR